MEMSHNTQKKIALINDISGFGRCSVTVQLPIISALKVQCSVMPTSIFTNHTAFESFYFDDYTDKMQHFTDEWQKLGLKFDGICTGFLGSYKQIKIVEKFFEVFKNETNKVVIDPVMGDNGSMYSTYTKQSCEHMKKLIGYANILTPNLTEACLLTDTQYREDFTLSDYESIAKKLFAMGPEKIVITGIDGGSYIANYCCEKSDEGNMTVSGRNALKCDEKISGKLIKGAKCGQTRCGTGDIFSSIIAADAVNGVELTASVEKASDFIRKCIIRSDEMQIPLTDGVCFEEFLSTLK